jgi:hypothetical protein
MLVTDLHLGAFRACSDMRFEALGRISLIAGGNNAGKSSTIEAAGLVLRPFDPGQWVQTAQLRDTSAAQVAGLWSMFPGAAALRLEDGPQHSKSLQVDATILGGLRTLRAQGLALESWVAREDARAEAALRLELRVDEARQHKSHVMEFQPSVPAAFSREIRSWRVFTVTPATHRSTRSLVEHLSHVVETGKKQLALELLRIFDPCVEDLEISAPFGRDSIYLTHQERGIVELASFGDGMRRSAAIALAMTRAGGGGMVLVDELEAGIHPRALSGVMSRLLAAAREADVQILATTHSLEAIDAVIEAVESSGTVGDVVAYHVRREGAGHHVTRYAGERLAKLREGGLDLR